MTMEMFPVTPDFDHAIRRVDKDGQVYLSLVDIMAYFTDSKAAGQYWRDTKKRLQRDGFESQEKILSLKVPAKDGKLRYFDFADAQTCLRIIQSIPSPKAEPIRQWMAQLARERIEETANPELGIQRAQERFIAAKMKQGYSQDAAQRFLQAAVEGRAVRNLLTDALKQTVADAIHYGQATNTEYRGMFGRTAREIAIETGFKNARDGMTIEGRALLTAAEATIDTLLRAEPEQIPFDRALSIIERVAKAYRLSVENVQALINIDLATGKPLLPSGESS